MLSVPPAASLSPVMSQVLLEGETHVCFLLTDSFRATQFGPSSALSHILPLVHAAFKSIASDLISGLALPIDADNQLYLFCHHSGSLSTLNSSSNSLSFDLCLGPVNFGLLPSGNPSGPLETPQTGTNVQDNLPHGHLFCPMNHQVTLQGVESSCGSNGMYSQTFTHTFQYLQLPALC